MIRSTCRLQDRVDRIDWKPSAGLPFQASSKLSTCWRTSLAGNPQNGFYGLYHEHITRLYEVAEIGTQATVF